MAFFQEPSPPSLVDPHHEIGSLARKIRRWKIKRELAVAADPGDSHIDGRRAQFVAFLATHAFRVALAIEQMIAANAGSREQAIAEKFSHRSGVRRAEPNVFGVMKQLDVSPREI